MHKTRNLGSTVYFWFAANDTSGSGADGETPQCDVRLAGDEADAAPVLSPTPTLLTHANYGAGLHEVAIAATAENGFAAGNEYAVFCTLLVDSQNPAGFLGSFYLTAADQAPLTVDDIQNGLATAGGGARTLTFTLSDGAGTVAGSLLTHVEDADGNLVAGPRTTSALGVVTYYLDDGTYYLVSADTAAWTGASNEVVVTASASVAITLAAKALPPPPAPGKYVVIINAADQTDTAVGAAERTYQVTRVRPAADATADLIRATERDPVMTDANGQASFEIGQTVESLEVLESWTDAAGVARSRTLHLSGFADAADDDGYVQLADVLVCVSGEV